MDWKEAEIKRLKRDIAAREEWLVDRKLFSNKLREWNVADRNKIEELQQKEINLNG